MSRVRRRTRAQPGREEVEAVGFIISAAESAELKRVVERERQRAAEALEDAPELKVAALLDSLGCAEEDVADFMVSGCVACAVQVFY